MKAAKSLRDEFFVVERHANYWATLVKAPERWCEKVLVLGSQQ